MPLAAPVISTSLSLISFTKKEYHTGGKNTNSSGKKTREILSLSFRAHFFIVKAMVKKSPAEAAGSINQWLERMMPVLTPSGIVLGFLLPGIFINLRPFVPLLFGIMTLSGSLKLTIRELGQTIRSPLGIGLFFLSSHILMPLAALSLSSLVFRGDADTVAGYVLLYSVPTAVSGFIWVSIFRGDNALCLTLILLDTLLAPLVVPGTISLLLGTQVPIDIWGIAFSLILMVVIPTIIGVGINEISRGKVSGLVCPYLNPLAKICMVTMIAANTSPVASHIRLDDPKVWLTAAMCIVLAAIGYVLSKFTGIAGRLQNEKRITLFFSAGLRNISAATTIAIEFFPEAAALPCLLGIVFQQVAAAFMGKILLGKKTKK
jgi:tagaturonate reductase